MNITAMSNPALDRVAIKSDSRGFKFELIENFADQNVRKRWLVKGVVALGETSAWIGPPGSLKSALMAELAICAANQVAWHGKKTMACHGVLYFALERADLVRRRLSAHWKRMGYEAGQDLMSIAVVPAVVDLMNPATIPKVIETIRSAAECFGQPIELVIFDTFAKLVAAGGGDEDKAKDQGKVFANIQRIKDMAPSPIHVALVGHTGKDETRGSRGSNAILGDVDLMVTISGGDTKTATVTKANDAAEGPLFSFKSEVHQFGTDEDGDPITVNVVSEETVETDMPASRASKWTKGLRLVHDAIAEAILQAGISHQIAGDGPVIKAVPVVTARAVHNQRYVSNGNGDRAEAERKAWARNFKQAREANLIGGELTAAGELIWIVS